MDENPQPMYGPHNILISLPKARWWIFKNIKLESAIIMINGLRLVEVISNSYMYYIMSLMKAERIVDQTVDEESSRINFQ